MITTTRLRLDPLRAAKRWWFGPVAPSALAVLRILIGAFVVLHIGTRYSTLGELAERPAELFEPVGAAWFLSEPLSPNVFRLILQATLFSGVCFVLGVGYRWFGPLFALLVLFVLSYRNSWSMVFHSQNVMALHTIVLGFSAAADVLSLDALLRRPLPLGTSCRRLRWRYGWPIRLMCALTVCTYLLSGIAKVTGPSGWGWASGESMRSQLLIDALRKELLSGGAPSLALTMHPHLRLLAALGIVTLIVELGAPLALINRYIAWIWIMFALLMHWGISLMMGIDFPYYLYGIIYAPFLVLDVWRRKPNASRVEPPAHHGGVEHRAPVQKG